MHVENPLALVVFRDITSHLWANNQIIVPHLIYLINLLIKKMWNNKINFYL